jgi:integrase
MNIDYPFNIPDDREQNRKLNQKEIDDQWLSDMNALSAELEDVKTVVEYGTIIDQETWDYLADTAVALRIRIFDENLPVDFLLQHKQFIQKPLDFIWANQYLELWSSFGDRWNEMPTRYLAQENKLLKEIQKSSLETELFAFAEELRSFFDGGKGFLNDLERKDLALWERIVEGKQQGIILDEKVFEVYFPEGEKLSLALRIRDLTDDTARLTNEMIRFLVEYQTHPENPYFLMENDKILESLYKRAIDVEKSRKELGITREVLTGFEKAALELQELHKKLKDIRAEITKKKKELELDVSTFVLKMTNVYEQVTKDVAQINDPSLWDKQEKLFKEWLTKWDTKNEEIKRQQTAYKIIPDPDLFIRFLAVRDEINTYVIKLQKEIEEETRKKRLEAKKAAELERQRAELQAQWQSYYEPLEAAYLELAKETKSAKGCLNGLEWAVPAHLELAEIAINKINVALLAPRPEPTDQAQNKWVNDLQFQIDGHKKILEEVHLAYTILQQEEQKKIAEELKRKIEADERDRKQRKAAEQKRQKEEREQKRLANAQRKHEAEVQLITKLHPEINEDLKLRDHILYFARQMEKEEPTRSRERKRRSLKTKDQMAAPTLKHEECTEKRIIEILGKKPAYEELKLHLLVCCATKSRSYYSQNRATVQRLYPKHWPQLEKYLPEYENLCARLGVPSKKLMVRHDRTDSDINNSPEFERAVKSMSEQYQAGILALMATGRRIGELNSLKIEKLSPYKYKFSWCPEKTQQRAERNRIKNANGRLEIMVYKDKPELFQFFDGKELENCDFSQISIPAFRKQWERSRTDAKLKGFAFHEIRHAVADRIKSLEKKYKLNPVDLSLWLGHVANSKANDDYLGKSRAWR